MVIVVSKAYIQSVCGQCIYQHDTAHKSMAAVLCS